MPAGQALPPEEMETLAYDEGSVLVKVARPGAAAMERLAAALVRAQEIWLAAHSTGEMVSAIGRTAERWLDRSFVPRVEAESWLPRITGYAAGTIRDALDALFEGLRAPALWVLIEEELGDRRALDTFVPRRAFAGRCRAYGPRLAVVSCAGNVPVASLPSVVHCLLVKSACLVRVARAEPLLPALFARTLAEEAPWMAECLVVVWWPAGDEAVERAAAERAEAWIAYGSGETLDAIRRRLPGHVRFLAHGHRIGFGVVARERLTADTLEATAKEAARDVVEFDQQGCVSPRVFFVEEGGARTPLDLARALADRLEALRETLPRRRLAPEEAAAVHQRRASAEMQRLAGESVALFQSARGTDWTVIVDPNADLSAAGTDRTAVIRPVARLDDLPGLLASYRRYLQTAAVAADATRWPEIATLLGAAGVTRLCPLGRSQTPCAGWHHDGRPRIADLVRWVDDERSDE